MKFFLKVSAVIMLIVCSIMMLYGFFASPNTVSNQYWLPTMVETGTLGFGIGLIVLGISEKLEEKKTNESTDKVIEKVETEIKEKENNNKFNPITSTNKEEDVLDKIITIIGFIVTIGAIIILVLVQ